MREVNLMPENDFGHEISASICSRATWPSSETIADNTPPKGRRRQIGLLYFHVNVSCKSQHETMRLVETRISHETPKFSKLQFNVHRDIVTTW